jgi:hypothetical protein
MNNERRIALEERYARRYLRAMKKAGYAPQAMNNGGGWEPYKEADLFAADDCAVSFRAADGAKGQLYFVYGNEPEEVLCDYSINLEPILAPIMEAIA